VPLLLATAFTALLIPQGVAGATRHEGLERYALRLVNCTRTGGWVQTDGSCKGYGSGKHSKYRAPLRFHGGISDDIAWPWARKIARARYCGHSLAGQDVDLRFRRAGYRHEHNGENVGCSYAWSPRKMVLRTHRMMQSERSYGGPHWRQMKDPDFRTIGIGVAKARGQTRIVLDFYGGGRKD
jgi:hypothetical protein